MSAKPETFDFAAEHAKAVQKFYPPSLLAQIRAGYAAMPEPSLKPVEHFDELAERRARREQQSEDDYNNSGRI